MFPDEFHLNTLDQLLPAIARLNPHVNIKAIVIGLMDRLSAYAEREGESESPEDRKKLEEEATVKLMEKLQLSKETKSATGKADNADIGQANGTKTNGEATPETLKPDSASAEESTATSITLEGDADPPAKKKQTGIPEHVKLYEIFYGQVTHLVNAQRLPIQDTIALLVSLANLAL